MGADMEEGNSCGFEGFEKRLEVEFGEEFFSEDGMSSNAPGLRSLHRYELDEMLTAAECTIVSELHNKWFDAYVLSESSLFIYPRRLILKTCGRTRLLNAVPVLLRLAAALSLHATYCKYSRGTFIFPHAQPFPYTSFTEETRVLDELFAPMRMHGSRSAHVLDGRPSSGSSSWHIYTATAAGEHVSTPMWTSFNEAMAAGECVKDSFSPTQTPSNTFTLEMCMTHLHPASASHFMNPSGIKSGADMTHDSGISFLLPNALICDFAFTPCGYSMNGMEEDALSTIHITPEASHSYASFEVMGYDPRSLDLQALVNRVVTCFKPSSLVMSVHASGYCEGRRESTQSSWSTLHVVPQGYVCNSSVRQELAGYGVVAFHTFTRGSSAEEGSVTPQPLCLCSTNGVNDSDTDGIYVTYQEPSLAEDGNDDDDGLLMPWVRQKGDMFELEDSVLEMVGKENHTGQAEFTYSQLDKGTGNDVAPYRDAYAELKAHQSISSYNVINHSGAVLRIVDAEIDIFQLNQEYYPNAKLILRVRPMSKGCPVEVSRNAEELLKKSKKLGVQVVGIALDIGVEPACVALCALEGAIRAAREVCGTAKALGLPTLKLLALGQGSSIRTLANE